jgi:hypothetical protein
LHLGQVVFFSVCSIDQVYTVHRVPVAIKGNDILRCSAIDQWVTLIEASVVQRDSRRSFNTLHRLAPSLQGEGLLPLALRLHRIYR